MPLLLYPKIDEASRLRLLTSITELEGNHEGRLLAINHVYEVLMMETKFKFERVIPIELIITLTVLNTSYVNDHDIWYKTIQISSAEPKDFQPLMTANNVADRDPCSNNNTC